MDKSMHLYGLRTAEQRRRRELLAVLLTPLLAFCAGCPMPVDGGDGSPANDPQFLDSAGNATLADATPLSLDAGDAKLTFTGTIESSNDLDIYSLGQVSRGDRVAIDVQRTSGNLDGVVALFDSREFLVAYNDDRTSDGSDRDPLLDIVIPGDDGEYFVAVAAYPSGATSGDYEAVVEVERGVGVAPPPGQIVFLNWVGGQNVVIRNVGVLDLEPFSAEDVGFEASQTADMKDRVESVVRQHFAGYDMTILNSDDHAVPQAAHSTVYFGGRNFQAFGVAQQIDTFNRDPNDDALIFTRTFRDAFRVNTSFDAMANALGNTVAHEIGHLLGLVHTADCDSLMDTVCFNERRLALQDFKLARLDDSVFAIGWQSAEEILGWVLGFVGM
jgi:hypothetical protein